MGSLKDVKGGFNIQSTAEIDCDPFRKLRKQDKAIHGSFKCSGKKSHPTQKGGGSGTTGGGGSGTSSGGSSSSSSAGAAADNVVNMPAMGMAAVFGALVQYAL